MADNPLLNLSCASKLNYISSTLFPQASRCIIEGFACTQPETLGCTAAPVTLEQLQHLQNLLQRTQGVQPGVNTQLQGVCHQLLRAHKVSSMRLVSS